MKPTIPTSFAVRWTRIGLGCCLLLVLSLTAAHPQQFPGERKTEDKKKMAALNPFVPPESTHLPVEPGAVEVAFTDGSNLKLLLREEKIALATAHGNLNFVVADIQRIEFATRLSEEDAKRVHTAILDLGSSEFSKRETASAQLLKLREKGYPALLRAAENKDLEVARRARELIQQIASIVPHQLLVVRPKDVVYTADSMIAGRIEGAVLKAHTSQFGAVQLKLADARSLRSQALQSESNPTNFPQPAMTNPPMGMKGMMGGPMTGKGFGPMGGKMHIAPK